MKKVFYLLCVLLSNWIGLSGQEYEVIARWDFQDGKPVSSDGRFEGALRGESAIIKDNDGNFVLRTPKSQPNKPSGLFMKKNYPELTPEDAFRMEIKFRLSTELGGIKKQLMLWDSKYIIAPGSKNDTKSNSGFAVALCWNGSGFYPCLYAGYGNSSLEFNGKPVALSTDNYHLLRIDYTPGLVAFFIDDEENAVVQSAVSGKLAKAVYPSTIGDRVSSNYRAFEGDIAEITLSKSTIGKIIVSSANRTGFIRLEPNPKFFIQFYDAGGISLKKQTAGIKIREYPKFDIPDLNIDLTSGTAVAAVKISSLLKPGDYNLEVTVEGETTILPFFISRERGDIYPVYMWGAGDGRKLHEAGFTHQLIYLSSGSPDKDDIGKTRIGMKKIDGSLKEGLYVIDNFNYFRQLTDQYLRINRDGKPYPRKNLDASNPEVVKQLLKRAGDTANAYGGHPAFEAALIQSEVRDGSNPSFTGFEQKAFKEYAGYDVPLTVNGRFALPYQKIPDFPVSQIIPDDYPLLKYYSWWWRVGDGWNPLHGAISKEYHQFIGHEFMTFYDPAVRVPPQWGSGGDVDCISQWSYTNADPIKVGQSADEILAMTAGRPGQKAMKMTQAFWYRSAAAPINKKVDCLPEWFSREPEAKFISISRDHLKIAFWSMISRKLDGIMYHGYGSLIERRERGSYRFTNPELYNVLAELSSKVIVPLGPLLKRIPERAPKIAMLESFASTIFAGRHASFGWGRGWWTDLHLALQWAHYQPAIIYDEHIGNGILEQVDVLVLPGVEVLKESTFRAIREFQRQGGLVIGDEYLLPGILPDITVNFVRRFAIDVAGSKKALQKLGAEIRKQLEPHWQSPFNCDNQDIVVRLRSWENADYLFAVNDKRIYGDYIGQWKKIQEQGLPVEGTITIRRHAGAVYDLVAGKKISFRSVAGTCEIPLILEAGGGRLLLVMDRPFGKVELIAPSNASPGKTFEVDIIVNTDTGLVSRALVPIHLEFVNRTGEVMPGSGYYCVENGQLKINLTPSLNEKAGVCEIKVRNLADGTTVLKKLQLGLPEVEIRQ